MFVTKEQGWTTEEVTEDGVMTSEGNDSSTNYNAITCADNYIPTVAEYRQAMGVYQNVLLSVGGSATVVLYLLYATQVYYTLHYVHKPFRKHVLWITHACPFMTLMSVVSVVVPRADTACTAFKVTFLSMGLSHFMDLTTAMFGNEKSTLAGLSEESFNLQVGPVCCCCLCLPSPAVNRNRLRCERWVLWQMPYTQAFYFMVNVVCSIGEGDSQGRLDPNFNMIWLTSLSSVTMVAGTYGLQVITALCQRPLHHYGYQRKSFSLKILLLATQMQSLMLDILSAFKVFPCLSPFISARVFKLTLENTLYLPEMLVIGLYTWQTYRTLELRHGDSREQGTSPDAPSQPSFSGPSIEKGSGAARNKIRHFHHSTTSPSSLYHPTPPPSPPSSSPRIYFSSLQPSDLSLQVSSFAPPQYLRFPSASFTTSSSFSSPIRSPDSRNYCVSLDSRLYPIYSVSSSSSLRPCQASSFFPSSSTSFSSSSSSSSSDARGKRGEEGVTEEEKEEKGID